MADVFLSYARATERAAKRIAAELRSCGYSVWFDENLPAHRTYSDVIEEQLEAADAVLVLWSSGAVRSQWVRSEANRARESGRLVQVRLDDARLPMPFDQVQCADLHAWSGDDNDPAWTTVISSVRSLVQGEGSSPPLPSHPASSRRRLFLIGGSAALLGGAGIALWRAFPAPEMSPEAQLLLEKGIDALQANDAFDTNDPSASSQAIALLNDATLAAPQSAAAWGALAMAYAVRRKGSPPAERAGFDLRSRAAAKRALALDSREPRALGALRMIDRVYRNWLAAEHADIEVLKLQPHMPLLLFLLADVLGSVGRWADASGLTRHYDRKHFLIPGADRQVILNLWSAGDFPGADEAIRLAVEHWAQQPQIWRAHLTYLTYSGHPSEALQMLDADDRPASIPSGYISSMRSTALALNGTGDAAAAVNSNLDYLKKVPGAVFQAAHACTALGAGETAISLLDGYYFGQGQWANLAPAGGDDDKITSPLFQPPMKALWRDPHFDGLVERIGLKDYWRRSQELPDFLKT
jgi:hypothetical protein